MLASFRRELPSDIVRAEVLDRNGRTRRIRMHPSCTLRGIGYLGLKQRAPLQAVTFVETDDILVVTVITPDS